MMSEFSRALKIHFQKLQTVAKSAPPQVPKEYIQEYVAVQKAKVKEGALNAFEGFKKNIDKSMNNNGFHRISDVI